MKKIFAAAAVSLLALAGCSATPTSSSSSAAATDEAVKLDGTYNSVEELHKAVVDAGYTCDAYSDKMKSKDEAGKETEAEIGYNKATCNGMDILTVTANRGGNTADIHIAEADTPKGEKMYFLVGDNWNVKGEKADLEKIAEKMKGEVQEVTGTSVPDPSAAPAK
ncbi:hypothetical protein J2S49_000860 [Arcanobacterium wilhelmae]|uniref:Lipoprotein n=1 Tax=Arcanobacterium wilhelmae TaxID=1803177 RepID=A0ABT9NAP4_9ACTO|nr:hypothetical protein [Arcanobacterium wilhelmae]MDP9800784.1 hypothetical protein [Arcanobacterium wilhelmae]WFN90161.1 hypothetical protein P8A24_08225 [Arcanobacterium wilhelmae]